MKNKIKATTLSVILNDSKSVHCGLEVDGEYINITLRFDRDKPMLCGFPLDWGLHDDKEDEISRITYEDDFKVYISEYCEEKIIRQLKKCIERQFKSKDWKKRTTAKKKKEILKLFSA